MVKVNVPTIERSTLTAKECATYLGISRDLVYILARENRIRYFKIGSRVLFRKRDLDDWIDEQMVQGNDENE